MEALYIEVYQESSDLFSVDVETLITLFIYKLSNSNNVRLYVKLFSKHKSKSSLVGIDLTNIDFVVLSTIPETACYCEWPVIVKENHAIAGVCSVARQLVKCADSKKVQDLLGFRESCLMACAETSVWTRFCEIDIIDVTKHLLKTDFENQEKLMVPPEILRFEYHMAQPVKMHNVYKIAREHNSNSLVNTKMPIEDLKLNHCYSEGLYMTLADVVLYPSFKIFFQKFSAVIIRETFPLIYGWFQKMTMFINQRINFEISVVKSNVEQIILQDYPRRSLYIGDAPSHRTEKGAFTKQSDIEHALEVISCVQNEISNKNIPYGHDYCFNWEDIPVQANPTGGALPEKRANRKSEQLENVAKAVCTLAGSKASKIVDFCSGSGHLGILLAVLLPHCHIILVENKEKSLERAEDRILTLKLQNVFIVQSNLDYFRGCFDIGVALHACGVATDLVMNTCIDKKAHFVLCPCCYGGIKNCHQVTYPLSKQYKNLNLQDKLYLTLAHTADQTHAADNNKTKQGFFCMDVIDTDRRLYAESCGYNVHLGKLQPVTCTFKNNLLVGMYKA